MYTLFAEGDKFSDLMGIYTDFAEGEKKSGKMGIYTDIYIPINPVLRFSNAWRYCKFVESREQQDS